jgi:hypothetical protein
MTCLMTPSLLIPAASPSLAQSNLIPPPNLTALPPDRVIPTAPVGHRQPKATALPVQNQAISETPQEAAAREDAALDRKIKGICRGC